MDTRQSPAAEVADVPCLAAAPSPAPGRRHRFRLHDLGGRHPLRYYAWRHPDPAPGSPWLCAVHGISRDAREQMRMLLPAVDAAGWSLIAPRFDKARYPSYQRLGREQGCRSDDALLALAASVEDSFGLPPVFDLFGFSGGAQFAHRFTMVAPSYVRRLAVAAAGWYTLPDTRRHFPHGIAPAPEMPAAPIRIDRYAAVPQLVLVGDRDITRDSNLRRSERLDQEQGRHRVERAIRWHRTMRRVSIRHGCDPDIHRLRLMPDVGHDFTECVTDGGLAQHLFDFLTCEEKR